MMLSARFPIVTPGARLPAGSDCDPNAQLVDGGYAEGTGLGTLADLAPQLTAILREKNQSEDVPYVPIVVYLRNSSGFDLVKSLTDVTAEPLVPLVGYAAKATQMTDAAWLQRLSGALHDVCGEYVVGTAGEFEAPELDESARRTGMRINSCHSAVAATTRGAVRTDRRGRTRDAARRGSAAGLGAVDLQHGFARGRAAGREGNCDRGKKAEYRPVNLCALLALAE